MHPILFEIPTPWGVIPVYSYGMMLGFSMIVAWYFVMHYGKKLEGLHPDVLAQNFVVTAVLAVAASRVLYILTNLDSYHTLGDIFSLQKGGLVAYGGFIGGFLACWAHCRIKGIPLLPLADIMAPVLGTGLFFTRIGCWLYGCDFGAPLGENPPALIARLGTFPHWDFGDANYLSGSTLRGSPAYSHHLTAYPDQMVGLDHSLPVHPTQLYESLAGGVIFAIAYYALRHRRFKGQTFFVTVAAYACWRFCIEYVRDDPERGAYFGFSTSQLISMAIIPLVVLAWIHVRRQVALHGEATLPDSVRSEEWLLEHRPKPAAVEPSAGTGASSKAAGGAKRPGGAKGKKK